MNLRPVLFVLLLALVTTAGAAAKVRNVTDPGAPRSLPEQGAVSVRWENPAQFSEIRHSHNPSQARRGNWVEQLATYLRQRAQSRLAAGQRLQVNITDIQRAGNYEPWRGFAFNDTRFIRDVYPPRITLTFVLVGADGQVIAEGERKLTDPGFLTGSTTVGAGDPLRFEKRLIDRWLASEFTARGG